VAAERNVGRFLRAAAFAAVGGLLLYAGQLGGGGGALIAAVFELWSPTKNRWAAHAMNWLLPAFAVAFCTLRVLAHDWWGLAFGTVFFGLAVANSVYLEPSPKRTRVFRVLFGALFLVAVLAVWRFFADGWMRR
jgi:hypothetical protein